MQLIDTHCHLDFDQYDDDRDKVLDTCQERIDAVVNVGTNHERNQASLDLARNHDVVYATMGLHPTYIKDLEDSPKSGDFARSSEPDGSTSNEIDRIVTQIRNNSGAIQAVGEIGLDYHHIREPEWRERQEDLFVRLLDVAQELDMPVVLHTRDAEQRATEIVQDYDLPVIQHCFNGAPELAEECVDRGYWISISTQVLYSSRVQELAASVPLEHILLETDAPFLYQGDRNMPWHVEESAEKIADIKELDVEDVARQTTENARDALRL